MYSKGKANEDKATYLICGGSRGYGAMMTNFLRSSGDNVYIVQRGPLAQLESVEDMSLDPYHLVCDFNDSPRMPLIVEKLYHHDIYLDGVIVAVGYSEEKHPELINAFDLQDHLRVNVLNPLMLTIYLNQMQRFRTPRSPVIWLCDNCDQREPEEASYIASKKALPTIVESMHRMLIEQPLVFAWCPPSRVPGVEDVITERLKEILMTQDQAVSKVIL